MRSFVSYILIVLKFDEIGFVIVLGSRQNYLSLWIYWQIRLHFNEWENVEFGLWYYDVGDMRTSKELVGDSDTISWMIYDMHLAKR